MILCMLMLKHLETKEADRCSLYFRYLRKKTGMNLSEFTAKQFGEVQTGGNWTASHLREQLSDITLQEAEHRIGELHTIAELCYHIRYFVNVLIRVLETGELKGKDSESFDVTLDHNEEKWKELREGIWQDGGKAALLISQLDPAVLEAEFTDPKYGTYFRNIHGIIEHTHYHLGQIVLLKKLIRDGAA